MLSAPSGAGKSSIARALRESDPNLGLSISATTRAPRAGEVEGVHYYFRTQDQFDAMVQNGELLEHATVFDRSYGTPRAPVEAMLNEGRDILFDIDWQGHLQLRAALPGDVLGVYVLPPSLADLEARLRGRGDTPEGVAARMAEARDEISHWGDFDHVIVNADFDHAVADVRAILRAARLSRVRQTGLGDFIAGL